MVVLKFLVEQPREQIGGHGKFRVEQCIAEGIMAALMLAY